MNNFVMLAPRLIVGMVSLLPGAWCVKGALESGMEFAGPVAALGFAGIAVMCWFLPAIARTTTAQMGAVVWLLWAAGTGWVLVTAIGFAAMHRSGGVSVARNAIEAYDRAAADRSRLETELATAKSDPKNPSRPHPRWISTAGCSEATVPKSDAYCSEIRRLNGELLEARKALEKPRPLQADPQAASLRKIMPTLTEVEINDWWPIMAAVVSELAASLGMSVAFAPLRRRPEPAPAILGSSEPTEPAWLAGGIPSEREARRIFARYTRSQPFGWMDGRMLRHLPAYAANENAA